MMNPAFLSWDRPQCNMVLTMISHPCYVAADLVLCMEAASEQCVVFLLRAAHITCQQTARICPTLPELH